nr:methyltransferase domain-containing protein [Gracilimonas sp.]
MQTFGKAAQNYHQEADLQRRVAKGLIASLIPWKGAIPPGPILEVGAGTGLLTADLIREFPNRTIIVSDASPQMLDYCKAQLTEQELPLSDIKFKHLDVNDYKAYTPEYGLIISNFAAHWFKDPSLGLQNLSRALLPGGIMLGSFPGNHSFPKWYEYCLELGIPHTANPLPDVEEVAVKLSMEDMQIDYYENDLYQEFDSSLNFFRHLKSIGSSTSTLDKSLSHKQFKLLVNHWDNKSEGKVNIKWHVVYLAAKKGS